MFEVKSNSYSPLSCDVLRVHIEIVSENVTRNKMNFDTFIFSYILFLKITAVYNKSISNKMFTCIIQEFHFTSVIVFWIMKT
jgi:hypothetical protein